MAPFLNPQLLLQELQKRASGQTPLPPGPATPGAAVNPESSGMLAPAGAAPGGPGTAVGGGASTPPPNPAIISDPQDIQKMQAHIMQQLTAPTEVGAAPQPPSLPAPPTMAPMPGGIRGRLVAGLSGIAGIQNPDEIRRRQQFQDAQAQYAAQAGPIQQTYQDRLKAYEAETRAKMEAVQGQRYGAMAASYMAPYFGISRSGTQPKPAAASKLSNVLKFNQGEPYMVTDPQTGQAYPIDPNDKTLSQIPAHLQPLVLAAQRQHQVWSNEQQRFIQTRGEAFRLNTMYPVLDAEDGMAPVMARGYEILNNPGRYNAGSLGNLAMNKQNILLDIGDLSKTVRADYHNLDREFSGEQRAMLAAAIAAPAGDTSQYIQSFVRSGMTPAQSKLATDLIQLKENGMALRGVIPGGATDMMRGAVANTLPGIATPNTPYGDIQLDALDAQIGRLSRGIPKVSMRAPGGAIPQAGEGTPPPPVKGPVASQPSRLAIQDRNAPKNIQSPADIQQSVEEYERGADGKLHLKKSQ